MIGGTTCNIGQACALSMQFPSGISADEVALVGTDNVRVGGGSQVVGINGKRGAVVSQNGQVEVQAGSHIGSIWTKGSASVGSGAIIEGQFFANSQSTVQAGAVAPPRQEAVGSVASVSWNVTFGTASEGDVWMEPDQVKTLAPGRFGDVRVGSRAVLHLSTGTYYFDSLQTEPNSRIEVNNTAGTAVIYVRGQLVHRGLLLSSGAPSDVLVGSFSNGTIELGDQFDATLVAPNALIRMAQPRNQGVHDGLYFGRELELQGAVRVTATPPSNSGPAIDDLDPDFTPDPDAPRPGDPPDPAGMTYDEFDQASNDYIKELIDSNYLGETVEIDAHPEAGDENELEDFSLPSNANTQVMPPQAIPPRDPSLHTPTTPAADAVAEFREEIEESEQQTENRYPALDQQDSANAPGAEYGTELEPPAVVPEVCLLTQQPPEEKPTIDPNSGSTIGTLDEFVIQPLVPDIVLGNRPSYLEFGAPGEGYSVNNDALPQFDGYWFFAARLHGGWNGEGMESIAEATVQAGGVLLKRHVELVRVSVLADGAILKQLDDGDVEPYFASSLETNFLGMRIDAASWEAATNEPALAKLKRTILNESRTLFENSAPPTLQVGPFGLSLDGGAEVKVVLALNLDPHGPELTLNPMFRVYLTVFAGLNLGIQIGLEGEADVVRVDMPFTAKLKWIDHLSPETCYSSADFDVTYRTIWSTLNGKLFVTVRVDNPLPIGPDRIEIVRKKVTDWDGPRFDTGEVDLIPTVEIPLINQHQSRCAFGITTCATQAVPDLTPNLGQAFSASIPYGQPACPGQLVYEVPASTNTNDLFLRSEWSPTDIDTAEECDDAKARVDVWRLLSDGQTWEKWDEFEVIGVFGPGTGCQTSFSGGKLPGGGTNGSLGFPWSWVDTSGGVQKVRVAIAAGTNCDARNLAMGTQDTFPF